MPATDKERLAKRIRWAARIVGLIAPVFFLFFMGEQGITDIELTEIEGFKVISLYLQSFLMGLCATIGLVGYIISWWRERPAGILLILAGVALVVIELLPASFRTPSTPHETHIIIVLLGNSPFLAAGVLFLLSWWLSRKTS